MLYYFYGADTYGARQAIAELARKREARIRWLDRENLEERTPAEWLDGAAGGLFGTEVLVVRDAARLPKGLQQDLVKALGRATSAWCVVWERGEPDKRTLLHRALKENAKVFPLPDSRRAIQWLLDEAQNRGGQIAQEAAQLLVERVGTDRWRLLGELDKLLLADEPVSKADVHCAVPEHESAEIFAVLDALAGGQRQQAVKGVQLLLAEGNSEFYILSMLAYQFRTLLMIRSGTERGKSPTEIAREGKLKLFAVQKNLAYARRWSLPHLREALRKVLATDLAIRRGKVDQRTGLVMLVLGLASR